MLDVESLSIFISVAYSITPSGQANNIEAVKYIDH